MEGYEFYNKVIAKLIPSADVKGAAEMKEAAEAELLQAQLNKKGGRRTQKRPTARRRVRRGSSKARKARTTRRK